jgi:hypothetical protein
MLTGCDLAGIPAVPQNQQPTPSPQESPRNYQQAEVQFIANPPAALDSQQSLAIEIVDDLTAFNANPVRYPMTARPDGRFDVHLPIEIGSLIKYRYLRGGDSLVSEAINPDRHFTHRVLIISGPAQIEDQISGWDDAPYNGPTGRITGRVTDGNGIGIPDAIVSSNGLSAITSAEGIYVLTGIPVGTHNLAAYSSNGSFTPYQQYARVEDGAITPADITLTKRREVIVTFKVHMPSDHIPNTPVVLLGNITPLGYVPASARDESTVIPQRGQKLTSSEDGTYSLTMKLPAGLDLRYKYSIGDGFWNAEHRTDGHFRVRQLIVPDHDVLIEDVVESWHAGDFAPVSLTLTAPENTPPTDTVTVQFKSGAWSEPITMWPIGDRQWLYVLNSPFYLTEKIEYRYCRNAMCGDADELSDEGKTPVVRSFSPAGEAQYFSDSMQSWNWWSPNSGQITVPAIEIMPKGNDYITGIELLPYYRPSMVNTWEAAAMQVNALQGNTLIVTPTWSVSGSGIPSLDINPSENPLYKDLLTTIEASNQANLKVGIYPQINYPQVSSQWWVSATRDYAWWATWFDSYHRYLLHNVYLAQVSGAEYLLLGDPTVAPSFSNGRLSNGDQSDVPADMLEWWHSTLQEIRNIYKGKVLGVVNYSGKEISIPEWMTQVDGLYVQWNVKLSDSSNPNLSTLTKNATKNITEVLHPLQETWHLPIILGLSYPSADGASAGCISQTDTCLSFRELNRPNPDIDTVALDLQEQVDLYNAVLTAVHDQDWIVGVTSRGYYPAATLQDKSSSVHGKPAGDVLWYWFGKLTPQSN